MSVLQEAYEHHMNGDLDSAEKAYRELLQENPEESDALHFLGLIMHQRGDVTEAEDCFRKAIAANEDNASAWNSLGIILLEKSDAPAAKEHFARAVKLDSSLQQAYCNLAGLALQEGDLDEARRQVRSAAHIDSEAATVLHLQGMLAMSEGDAEKASVLLQQAVASEPTVVHLMDLAQAYRAKGAHAFASDALRRAMQDAPGDEQLILKLADVEAELGRMEDAANLLQQVKQKDHPLFHSVSARMAISYRHWQRAVQHLTEIARHARLRPVDAEMLALSLARLGLYEKAEEVYTMLCNGPQASADAHRNRVQALQASGKGEEAMAASVQALTFYPGHFGLLFLRAKVLAMNTELEAAMQILQDIPEKRKDFAVHMLMAETSARQAQFDEAREFLEKAGKDKSADKTLLLLAHQQLELSAGNYRQAWDLADQRLNKIQASDKDASQRLQKVLDRLQEIQELARLSTPASWPKTIEDGKQDPVFVFAFPGAGLENFATAASLQEDFLVLTDRLAGKAREDIFSLGVAAGSLDVFNETSVRLERKKYFRHASSANSGSGKRIVDIMPMQMLSLDLVYRLFPKATILWLDASAESLKVKHALNGPEALVRQTGAISMKAFSQLETAWRASLENYLALLPAEVHRVELAKADSMSDTEKKGLADILGVESLNEAFNGSLERFSAACNTAPFKALEELALKSG